MRLIALVLAILAVASVASAQDHHPELERLRAAALRLPSAEVQEHPGFTIVIEPGGLRIHYFTKPGHFAHPGTAIRSVEQRGNEVFINTSGTSFGTTAQQADFQRWMAQFRELDERIRREMKARSGNSRQ